MTLSRAWIAAGLLAAAAGCASTQAARARTGLLTAQLDALRYSQPLDDAWNEARSFLAARGYPVVGEDARAIGQKEGWVSDIPLASLFRTGKETSTDRYGVRMLETGWGRDDRRYRLEGWQDGTSSRLKLVKIAMDPTEHKDGQRFRDVELELELAYRLDPEAAVRIEAALEAQARPKG